MGNSFLCLFFCATILAGCQLPWTSGDRNCADRAHLNFPIDLQSFTQGGQILPFGVHGGTTPEGHAGIDFILDSNSSKQAIEVKASFTAEIISITPESAFPGSSCIVMDSACIEVNLCHLQLDKSLKVGNTVERNTVLGSIGFEKITQKYNLHFGTYSGPSADWTCPLEFLDFSTGNIQDTVTWMERSEFPEKKERSLSVPCQDGSLEDFFLPAEDKFCATRLPEGDRSRMKRCLGNACAGIW
jgi:hypothetical protein